MQGPGLSSAGLAPPSSDVGAVPAPPHYAAAAPPSALPSNVDAKLTSFQDLAAIIRAQFGSMWEELGNIRAQVQAVRSL